MDIELPEGEEFETIAGFIFNRAGRLVQEGEVIEYDGVTISVESVENTRITEARLRSESDPVDSAGAAGEGADVDEPQSDADAEADGGGTDAGS
jgi:putative hemolysin